MSILIYVLAAAVIAGGSLYMIFATCYDDGSLGKIALGIMALGGGAVLWQWFNAVPLQPPGPAVFIAAGAALFMARHLVRFCSKGSL